MLSDPIMMMVSLILWSTCTARRKIKNLKENVWKYRDIIERHSNEINLIEIIMK